MWFYTTFVGDALLWYLLLIDYTLNKDMIIILKYKKYVCLLSKAEKALNVQIYYIIEKYYIL